MLSVWFAHTPPPPPPKIGDLMAQLRLPEAIEEGTVKAVTDALIKVYTSITGDHSKYHQMLIVKTGNIYEYIYRFSCKTVGPIYYAPPQ